MMEREKLQRDLRALEVELDDIQSRPILPFGGWDSALKPARENLARQTIVRARLAELQKAPK